MARWRAGVGDAELREAILEEVVPQVECIQGSLGLLGAGDAAGMFDLGALESGADAEVWRWDLPDWCPERWVGEPGDLLLLTAGNVLVELIP